MLLATVSLWALNFTVSKYILDHGFHPLAYSSIRYTCAALIFAGITLAWEGSLRIARRDVWWRACRVTEYWRTRLDWHSALGTAQQYGIADSASFPSAENESRFGLVDTWRAALVKQLLTPAPDLGAVAWKRAQLRAENYRYSDVEPERIERAIADDVAFLEAHPTRRSIAASRQSSKPDQEQ